jgi:glycosyltransferase involved in cell wall biosynthesis
LTVLEALVSGTPVISSRRAGTVEILSPETGIVCDSEEEWRGALNRLSELSPVRCREVALAKYHYKRMTKDYLREYQREIEHFSA